MQIASAMLPNTMNYIDLLPKEGWLKWVANTVGRNVSTPAHVLLNSIEPHLNSQTLLRLMEAPLSTSLSILAQTTYSVLTHDQTIDYAFNKTKDAVMNYYAATVTTGYPVLEHGGAVSQDAVLALSAIQTNQGMSAIHEEALRVAFETQDSAMQIRNKPNKTDMSVNVNVQGKGKGRGAKRQGRKPKKAVAAAQQKKKQRARPNKRKNQGPRRTQKSGGRALAGKGSTRNMTMNKKSFVIEEDEYIGEIAGSVGFATTAFPVNIGQTGTFPWAAGMVKDRYEKYSFESLVFYVKREVSEFATNGTTGKVMLSFDNDASDSPPTNKQAVEDTDPHVDGMPCENIALAIPQKMLKRLIDGFYIRPAGLPGATDIKTYDIGNLFVSTQGCQNTSAVGELHVKYRVRVFTPILGGGVQAAPANNTMSWFQTNGADPRTNGVAATMGFGTTTVNGIGISNNLGVFTPPKGNYAVDMVVTCQDTVSEIFAGTLGFTKNGAQLITSALIPEFNISATLTPTQILTATTVVSANGTDAFRCITQLFGAAGVLQCFGMIRWISL